MCLRIYVNLLLLTVITTAELIPNTILNKRQAKVEIKKDNMGYSDEMFNIDTLAGIGLGKRSSPSPRHHNKPHYILIDVDDLQERLNYRPKFSRFHQINL
ncbi:unnamed protein product [Bursaphelenchus okinawaensis]|uniref:Uncharacterized protein n=1 Tax=Bursaphelenchus okinawaensis TaxID=465554 RepID=A0A811K420_9BILA|nr:unnamed protein product [Bursaphelenchus okinawaensis]CAG9090939.1 unnamed protein product [Bursaphelenchus okinawaensis]